MKALENTTWWVIGLSCGIMLGYAIRMSQDTPVIVHKNIVSLETANEFRRKMKKHGQENTVHVWQEWWYMNEDGKKCKLGEGGLR